ncbi:MAG: hypothetical protein QM754_18575 [Tepidisphaeraceae bacterium]
MFDVTGAATSAEAFAALVADDVDFDQSYDDDNPDAVVTGIGTQFNAVAGMYTFTVSYGDGAGDGFLSKPPKIRYEPYTYTELVDFDVDGVPYQNSAGTPLDPPMEREMTGVIVTVRRPAASYDFATIYPYFNTLNSASLTLPDGNSIPAGKGRFLPVAMSFKDSSTTNTWLDFKWDVRSGVDPWKKNVIDQGAEGWGIDAALKTYKGVFTTDAAGAGPAGIVRLNGAGKPIDTTTFSRVADEYGNRYGLAFPPGTNPITSVVSPTVGSGGLSTYTGSGTTGIAVLSFKRYKSLSHAPLLT